MKQALYFATAGLSVVGSVLVMASLFIPFWYERLSIQGIVVTRHFLGLWLDRLCEGMKPCRSVWWTTPGYRRADSAMMPAYFGVRGLVTAAAAFSVVSLVLLLALWLAGGRRPRVRPALRAAAVATAMLAGLLAVSGTLVLAARGEGGSVSWAPFVAGVGGGAHFLAGVLACVAARGRASGRDGVGGDNHDLDSL